MQNDAAAWRAGSEARRGQQHEDMDALKHRITVLETIQACREHGGCK